MLLNDAEEVFYRHARIVLEAVLQAEASLRATGDGIRGDLRVSAPPMDSPGFLGVIADFVEAHPHVRLQLHFTRRLIDLQRDGYDVALRATSQLEPGPVVRTLLRASLIGVASPAYLELHGTPTKLRDLREHRCLMGFARGELPQTHWKASGHNLRLMGTFFSYDPGLLCLLAERGLGIAFVPALVAAKRLARGELLQVMPGQLKSEGRIAIVYPESELMPPQVRAFVEWMVSRVRQVLGPARRA